MYHTGCPHYSDVNGLLLLDLIGLKYTLLINQQDFGTIFDPTLRFHQIKLRSNQPRLTNFRVAMSNFASM